MNGIPTLKEICTKARAIHELIDKQVLPFHLLAQILVHSAEDIEKQTISRNYYHYHQSFPNFQILELVSVILKLSTFLEKSIEEIKRYESDTENPLFELLFYSNGLIFISEYLDHFQNKVYCYGCSLI